MIEGIIEAVRESASAATTKATASLRRSAYESGWDGRAASSLEVYFDGNRWAVSGSEDAASEEYGGPGRTPNAAVRRFGNHSKVVESAMLADLSQRLRGVL